ncbi:hypothetical protein M3689_20080 [Alkalihalophilus marmarensis]|uniref:Uncharacterized protein n=1 Tax=Alkalihalophilus marmarensis DSM 21297 TaxID=1188261 RepID=U6SK44_9BACI|nr:hypothetical protein [Alkalihalophilus marmarensis]ERN51300.1 hypothetical protein A33I_20690 [Alkalihalophilus marmarensis DSM 21297]MCM3491592.1 hypothetical protein [Alkalihalophilus marmarensis]
MNPDKMVSTSAFELIFDIEIKFKRAIAKAFPSNTLNEKASYSTLVNHIVKHQYFNLTSEQSKKINETVAVRNKVCHMKEISTEEFDLLQEIQQLIITLEPSKPQTKPSKTPISLKTNNIIVKQTKKAKLMRKATSRRKGTLDERLNTSPRSYFYGY